MNIKYYTERNGGKKQVALMLFFLQHGLSTQVYDN